MRRGRSSGSIWWRRCWRGIWCWKNQLTRSDKVFCRGRNGRWGLRLRWERTRLLSRWNSGRFVGGIQFVGVRKGETSKGVKRFDSMVRTIWRTNCEVLLDKSQDQICNRTIGSEMFEWAKWMNGYFKEGIIWKVVWRYGSQALVGNGDGIEFGYYGEERREAEIDVKWGIECQIGRRYVGVNRMWGCHNGKSNYEKWMWNEIW